MKTTMHRARRVRVAAAGTVGIAAVAAISALAVAATAPPAGATWIDSRPTATEFVGAGRSPDGSIVLAAPVRRSDPAAALLARLRVQPAGTARRSTITAGPVARPTSIASTGESVYVLGSSSRGSAAGNLLGRATVSDEVHGARVLRGPAGLLGGLGRVDHLRVGAQWRSNADDVANRAVALGRNGFVFQGTRPFDGDVSAMTATTTGALIDLWNRLQWRPAGAPTALAGGSYSDLLADGTRIGSATGRIGTAAENGAIAVQAAPVARLKEPTTDKIGDAVTDGLGDARLAIVSPSGPARIAAVPVPGDVDEACRANALTVDSRDLVLSDPWNGPDGAIWAVAGCGRGRDDALESNAPTSADPAPIRWWLARWDVHTLESSTVALPDPPTGVERSVQARGFVMADHAMWVVSMAGTLRVPISTPSTATAKVSTVRQVRGGRVRLVISCIGQPGDGCFGHATISDRRGKLRTVSYGVDAGTAEMDPLVIREFTPPRRISGPLAARLTS